MIAVLYTLSFLDFISAAVIANIPAVVFVIFRSCTGIHVTSPASIRSVSIILFFSLFLIVSIVDIMARGTVNIMSAWCDIM